jgi:hypothetical protein
VKIIEINSKDLSDIYITSDGVKDFMKKCIDYVMNNFTKDEKVLKLIKMKCYVQLKVYFAYYHDKPYEPTFKTLKRSFYVDKLIQRSNLVQSVDELKSVLENQSIDILRMMDKFENQGSNWVAFKLRFIRYTDVFRRARGFIPTPSWLHGRKAVINIQNEDDYCFLKCIYRYFNRDRHRHDYSDIPMDVVNRFFENRCVNISIFDNGINHETVREFG